MKESKFLQTAITGCAVFTGLLMAKLCLALQVQSAVVKPNVHAVEVSGMRDQDWKSYRIFMRGMEAYQANRHLAPDTQFRFVLRPQTEGLELSQIRLKLVSENVSIPVPLADDWSFELPRNQLAYDENAELLLNQRQHQMRWNLLAIRTKGLPENRRRLGDLRLTCEVFAAMEDWERWRQMLRIRNINADNACISPKLAWTFYEGRKIRAATLMNDRRTDELRVTSDRKGFVVSLFDQAWSDHALIQLEFEDAEN